LGVLELSEENVTVLMEPVVAAVLVIWSTSILVKKHPDIKLWSKSASS